MLRLSIGSDAACAGWPEKGEREGGVERVRAPQARERLSPARDGEPPMPHPAPAHKSFADRNSLYQQITDKIIAELEQGRVPWVQPWGNVTVAAPRPAEERRHRPRL